MKEKSSASTLKGILTVFLAFVFSSTSIVLLLFLYPVRIEVVQSQSTAYSDPSSLFYLQSVTHFGSPKTIETERINIKKNYEKYPYIFKVRYTYKSFPPIVCYVSYDFDGGQGSPSLPIRKGYTFIEWVKTEAYDNQISLKAIWQLNSDN